MVGAIDSQVAFTERRVDEPAMVGARLVAMSVGREILAAQTHALLRNGAASLKLSDRACDNAEQARLIISRQSIDKRAKAQRPTFR